MPDKVSEKEEIKKLAKKRVEKLLKNIEIPGKEQFMDIFCAIYLRGFKDALDN